MNDNRLDESAKLDFLSSFTHEIKTPINIILSAVQLMKHKDKTGENSEYCRYIEENSYKLLRLIANIIDTSKMISGAFELHEQVCDYGEFVSGICDNVRIYCDAKNLELEYKNDCGECIFAFDIGMTERTLLNLLTNSINYTDAGGKITVRISKEGGFVFTEVQDTGCGIPPEKRNLIFTKFAEINVDSFDEKRGSGLGLFLVKKYIDAMKGTICYESECGRGTIFKFALPEVLAGVHKLSQYESAGAVDRNEVRIQMSAVNK